MVKKVGKYELHEKIGFGSFGTVYKGREIAVRTHSDTQRRCSEGASSEPTEGEVDGAVRARSQVDATVVFAPHRKAT